MWPGVGGRPSDGAATAGRHWRRTAPAQAPLGDRAIPTSLWAPAVALAGSLLALLVLFTHPWLVLGVGIEAVLPVARFFYQPVGT